MSVLSVNDLLLIFRKRFPGRVHSYCFVRDLAFAYFQYGFQAYLINMDPTPECASGNSSISVVLMTVALLDTKGLNVEGVALAGSRARGQERDTSDYDLLVISRTVRSIHIEDVRVDGHKVQLFLLPFRGIDAFLVLNCVSDNGIMAKMINGHVVAKGSALFTRIKTNLSTNLHGMEHRTQLRQSQPRQAA